MGGLTPGVIYLSTLFLLLLAVFTGGKELKKQKPYTNV